MKSFRYIAWSIIFFNILTTAMVFSWKGRSKPIKRSLKEVLAQDIETSAKKYAEKCERRRLRKERRKKIFSSLARTCLYALRIAATHGASALFKQIPDTLDSWVDKHNLQRNITGFNQRDSLDRLGLLVDSVLAKIPLQTIKNNSELEILSILASQPAGIQRLYFIERLALSGNVEELFEKLFFGACTVLPKKQERAIRLVYRQHITGKKIALKNEQKKTTKDSR